MEWETDQCVEQRAEVQESVGFNETLKPIGEKPTQSSTTKPSARSSPTKAARISHHKRWVELLPTLVPHYLQYCETTIGKPIPLTADLKPVCNKNCPKKTYQILCLFYDHADTKAVNFCSCEGVVPVLIKNGLFPGSPSQPKIAISIALLDFYQALFERSCDAVNALASALVTHYRRRGFPVLNSSGNAQTASVGRLVDEQVAQTIQNASKHLQEAERDDSPPNERAHQFLCQKCPACYARRYGSSLSEGCDVHAYLDGCFSHRRLKHAGDPPHAHVPEHYVPKEQVDAMGDHISDVRKKPAKARTIVVPDEAVDECEDGHIAGTGTKVKSDTSRYDDTGTMALVCRHDTPILLANIDTPGEQQKYAAAMIQKLSPCYPKRPLSPYFTISDASLTAVSSSMISRRMTIATSIMHSYAHQWACQLVYNPRLREGLGLSDGEGVERYWSRMRKIISVTRTSGRKRRLWLIDRLTARLAAESRDNLGSWMIRRYKDLDEKVVKQTAILKDCGVPESELRDLWKEQRVAQLSVRAHAPTRLKKDLDKLIAIQGDLDRVETTIKEATTSLGKASQVVSTLKDLTSVYDQLSSKLDSLYISLNISESFPTLRDLPFAVVHKLLIARDLKINIRKRAIASFFENERLEQAVGGRNETLGTKNHQQVRAAIKKRKPAFVSAIRRFNKTCAELKELIKPEWNIPVPEPLPTDVHELRDESHLMEDVWIERTVGRTPRWIESPEVRTGIQAMLTLDRCKEERLRLGKEADNMCRWFGDELTKTELAIADPTIWLPVIEHHTHIIDFDSATFADDEETDTALEIASPDPFQPDPTLDADAADLPNSDAFMLQDIFEDEAEDSGNEEPNDWHAFNVIWVAPVRSRQHEHRPC
ncbi:hypothetical protein EST38_g11010 [Candolleomyces aberdarensis]|uniref:CxC1-like cysteine cluster associated with KDZ transposases domain-containing protein n=1 Tax=Candolleomyces aberdarensis TaxID=2316362 RepID=A0A4Q2D5Y8_9AGAR|nr:hypothetical protein EST38_g11010 [Candolleomyces aberdarensis]